jgi:hypothetical protein
MTQEEIIEMARQAWVDSGEGWVAYGWFSDRANALEIFAKLVAAKEREACAKVCEDREEQWRKAGFFKDVHEFREMAFYIRARGEA